jgi:hypothetical protein
VTDFVMEFKEIGRRLGMSEQTAHFHFHRALAKLRGDIAHVDHPRTGHCGPYRCGRCGEVGHNARTCRR